MRILAKRLLLLVTFFLATNVALAQDPNRPRRLPRHEAPARQRVVRADGAGNEKRIDALLAKDVDDRSPGAAVLVVEDGKVVLQKAYGMADVANKVPISKDTRFRLASLTKQFTAMAVMILANRNCLTYDDPITTFFPRFQGAARRITVRHLLNHTGGLPEFECLFVQAGKIDIDWPRSSESKPSAFEPTTQDTLEILIDRGAPGFEPGKRFEYSNSGYVVLAMIVEKVSGKRYAEFLRDEIFTKIGMTHTLVQDERKQPVPSCAKSYTGRCGAFREIDYTPLNLIYGEDNIFTTIEDMFQWDQALAQDKLVPHGVLVNAFTAARLNSGGAYNYGFGWGLGQIGDLDDVSHSGAWVGFNTYIIRILDQPFTVVVLANFDEIKAGPLGDKIVDIYLGGG